VDVTVSGAAVLRCPQFVVNEENYAVILTLIETLILVCIRM